MQTIEVGDYVRGDWAARGVLYPNPYPLPSPSPYPYPSPYPLTLPPPLPLPLPLPLTLTPTLTLPLHSTPRSCRRQGCLGPIRGGLGLCTRRLGCAGCRVNLASPAV